MVEILNGQDGASEPTPSTRKARTPRKAEAPVELRKASKAPVGTVIRGYPTEVRFVPAQHYRSGDLEPRLRFASAYAGKAIRNEDRSAPGATAEVTGERMVEFLRFAGVPSKAIETLDRPIIEKALAAYSERLAEVTLRKGREVRFEFAPVVSTRKGRKAGAARPELPAEKAASLAK